MRLRKRTGKSSRPNSEGQEHLSGSPRSDSHATDLGTIETVDDLRPHQQAGQSGKLPRHRSETVEKFAGIVRESKTLVASGRWVCSSENGFESGTKTILEAMANSSAFTVIGGGHLAGYASILGISQRFSHVSTAGGSHAATLGWARVARHRSSG